MKAESVVYIHGDEPLLVDRALAEVEEEALQGGDPGFNREVFEVPQASSAEVLSAARTLPFLGGRRLVVVKNAHQWSADQWKTLLPYIESPNPTTCLVFVAAQLDRRLAAGKLLAKKARVVDCPKPRERDLPTWAQRLAREAGLRPDPKVLQSLVLRVGPDLQLLSQEIEKLRVFAGEGGKVTEADVEALVGETRGTTVFVLCDALGQRELGGALRALRRLLQLGEAPVKLLHMIVRHFRILWTGREVLDRSRRPDPRAAAAALGVPPFVVDKTLAQARGWTHEEFRESFGRFVEADLALKTGGGEEVLEALVIYLCVGKNEERPGAGRGASGADAVRRGIRP